MFQLESNLSALRSELAESWYHPRPYRYFRICEPKERTVSVAAFCDRVIHHAVINVLEPVFEKSFYAHSYATRKNKGTHRAVCLAQWHLQAARYYLKSDIEKYFDNIDHQILLEELRRKIDDERMMELLRRIVSNSDTSRGTNEKRGLPIGNLTSQFLANVYLNRFDHFVVQGLGAKRYIRYMDDFVVFADRLEFLREVRESMRLYLERRLHIRLKDRATITNSRMNGLSFLGYRIFPSMIRLKRENVKRMRRKISRREIDYTEGRISERKYCQSLQSLFGYLQFARTWKLRTKWLEQNGRRSRETTSGSIEAAPGTTTPRTSAPRIATTTTPATGTTTWVFVSRAHCVLGPAASTDSAGRRECPGRRSGIPECLPESVSESNTTKEPGGCG